MKTKIYTAYCEHFATGEGRMISVLVAEAYDTDRVRKLWWESHWNHGMAIHGYDYDSKFKDRYKKYIEVGLEVVEGVPEKFVGYLPSWVPTFALEAKDETLGWGGFTFYCESYFNFS